MNIKPECLLVTGIFKRVSLDWKGRSSPTINSNLKARTMTSNRREFITGTLAAASALALSNSSSLQAVEKSASKQEYYELRIYRIENAKKQKMVSNYIEKGLVPALNRMGISRVGVFTEQDKPKNFSIYMLIPYSTIEQFTSLNDKLEADPTYTAASKEYHSQPLKDPIYTRIQSKFMKAFSGMPVIEMPSQTKGNKPRLFELRTYESHTTDAARRKVDMFNSGEIDIMRDVKMGPLFYGETLIGDDVPNLTYMLSADDMDANKAAWKGFLGHPEWDRMKKIDKYKGTVSKISKGYLLPTEYSQI